MEINNPLQGAYYIDSVSSYSLSSLPYTINLGWLRAGDMVHVLANVTLNNATATYLQFRVSGVSGAVRFYGGGYYASYYCYKHDADSWHINCVAPAHILKSGDIVLTLSEVPSGSTTSTIITYTIIIYRRV